MVLSPPSGSGEKLVVLRFVAVGEEDSDGVGCNFRRGGIGDFEVVFLSFLVLMIMRRGLLLWGHFIIGCGLDALAEGLSVLCCRSSIGHLPMTARVWA